MGRRLAGTAALIVAAWLGLSSTQIQPGNPVATACAFLDHAASSKRPAVVGFAAEWCLPCVEMKHSTFTDPDVLRDAARFSLLQADVTESTGENELLLEEFGVLGVPTTIFYDRAGREVDRVVGFVNAEKFRRLMLRADGGTT